MAFTSSKGGVPPTPTLPTGVQIASFDTYLEAQRAVDLLSDKEFEVQHTTIVGTDLRMVERITGRLSYPRVALAGAMSGAWFGLFVGVLFGLLSEGGILVMLLPALIIGAAFGMLFALVSYAFTGGKRDFTSSSQVVASKYALLCEQSRVGEAMRLLNEAGIRTRVGPEVPATAPAWQQGPGPQARPGPAGAPGPYGAQRPAGPGQQPGPYGAPGPAGPGQQPGPAGPQRPVDPDQPAAQRPAGPAQPGAYGAQRPPGAAPAPERVEDAPATTPSPTPWVDEHGNPRYGQRRPALPEDGEERSS